MELGYQRSLDGVLCEILHFQYNKSLHLALYWLLYECSSRWATFKVAGRDQGTDAI